ncbi:type 1 glutamine amidotransferase domain-containing protein [Haloferula chungangensis]|uniref:Type 1 glutamine amidotransferase domain-containing protein n=1 Tax=Haloferula chungangensis TaxID=1048331 RepID=A0ABW2L6Q8_9BACT
MKAIITAFFAMALALFAEEKKPLLLVLTNHGELGETGKKTGFFLSEAAHPHEVFTEAGYEVTLASPKGGFAPLDPKSLKLDDAANEAFWKAFGNGDEDRPGVAKTMALSEVKPGEFGGIFFAGGHGTMWDFRASAELRAVTASIYSRGGVVGAVCHGPAALVNLKLPDGSLLVSGKKVAVFTNEEEDKVELSKVVPFMLQTAFEDMGAKVQTAAPFSENALRDGRLVTGQNPASAKKAGELFVEALGD